MAEQTTSGAAKFVQHGEHIDTLESVEFVFRKQRKLSFTYGAVFFGVTLLIPAFSVLWEGWYATPFWGGFTLNYFVVSLLYFVFLWVLAWTYNQQADKLDTELMGMADEISSKAKTEGGGQS